MVNGRPNPSMAVASAEEKLGENKKWGGAILLIILLGIILMVKIPSMTSQWSVLGPLLLLLGSWGPLAGWVLYKTQSGGKNWRWKHAVTRQRWFNNHRIALGWFLHQPLMIISIWGFLGPAIKSLWPVLPIWLTMYNGAGWTLGVLKGKDEGYGEGWLKFISVICLLGSMYWMGWNSIYAIQGQWGADGPRPNPLGPLGIDIPQLSKNPDTQPAPSRARSGDQIRVVKSTWSAQTKKGIYWVRLAPGDPLVVPFNLAPDAVVCFDNPSAFKGSSWKVKILVEKDGKVKEHGKADIQDLVIFFLWDPKTNKVFRHPVTTAPINLPIRPGDSYSMKELLGSLENYPQDRALQPCFAINTDHPIFQGGEKMGGCIEFEFRLMGMSLSDHI